MLLDRNAPCKLLVEPLGRFRLVAFDDDDPPQLVLLIGSGSRSEATLLLFLGDFGGPPAAPSSGPGPNPSDSNGRSVDGGSLPTEESAHDRLLQSNSSKPTSDDATTFMVPQAPAPWLRRAFVVATVRLTPP